MKKNFYTFFLLLFFIVSKAQASTCGYLFTQNKEINNERNTFLSELERIRFSTKILGLQFTDSPALKLKRYFAQYSIIKEAPIELVLFTEIKRHVFSRDYTVLPVEQVLHDLELGLSLSVNDESVSYKLKRSGVVVAHQMYYKNRTAFITQLHKYRDPNYYPSFSRFFRRRYLGFLLQFHPDLEKSTSSTRELIAEQFLALYNYKKLDEIIKIYRD